MLGFTHTAGIVNKSYRGRSALYTYAGRLNLTATRGHSTSEVRICYERAESLCHSLDRPVRLVFRPHRSVALFPPHRPAGDNNADRLASLRLGTRAERCGASHGAFRILAVTLYFSGDFAAARQYSKRGVQLWRRGAHSPASKRLTHPPWSVSALRRYASGISARRSPCQVAMAQAVSLAKELNDAYASAVALFHAAFASHFDA